MLNERHKEFIKLIESAARARSAVDVFGDAVHLMAQAMWKPFALGAADEVEADWQRTRERYTDEEYRNIVRAFAVVQLALEERREEFLGVVLEAIGAANTHNGQYLTPGSVAGMMARVSGEDVAAQHRDGDIVTLNDPACGASVLLIAQAEYLRERGVPQRDILVSAGDIDGRACDMSFIELSLLGYAAKVEHLDALSMTRYSPTRYTVGYFLHCMPMRMRYRREGAENDAEGRKTGVGARGEISTIQHTPEAAERVEAEFHANVAQGVFDF